MSLIAAWVLFPALLALVALGNALVLERLAGVRLPGALLVPVGLAVVVVVVQAAISRPGLAGASTPAVVVLAVAGLALGRPWRRLPLDRAAGAAAAAVFAVYAAPVVLSGKATFTGYIKLDDTATFLALVDRAMEHGRSLSGLPPSTYEAILASIMPSGYPLGSLLPLGAVGPLSGQDLAWLYQPWMAFATAMAALALYALARELLSPRRAALAAAAAGSSTLLFGFALWGGVKEICTAWLIAALAALVPGLIRETGVRAVLPVAVVFAAVADTLSLAGAAWVGPALLVALVVGVRSRVQAGRATAAVAQLAAFAVAAYVLSRPAISTVATFTGQAAEPLKSGGELGNLVRPLRWDQVFGVWLGGDFRVGPRYHALTWILVALVAGGGVAGLVLAALRRSWGIVAYATGAVIGSWYVLRQSGPWVDAKTLAIVSPTALVLCFVGLLGVRLRATAIAAGAVVAGLLVGNAMAYHQTFLAPRDRLAELGRIGDLAAGKGPTLLPLYDPYAARHFLREADPEESSELRRRQVLLNDGQTLPTGSYADLDAIRLGSVTVYRTIVLPRSPIFSRPPSVYRRTWRGRFFDVYERAPGAERTILAHQGIGSATQVAGEARCSVVRDLGRQAQRQGAHLEFVARAPAVFAAPFSGRYPRAWGRGVTPNTLAPWTGGTLRLTPTVPSAGRYDVWLAGSFASDVDVVVDGRRVGQVTGLANQGDYAPVGTVRLQAGAHVVDVRYPRRALSPGTGVPLAEIGPLALAPVADRAARVITLPAERAPDLCRRSLDWIEVVRPAAPAAGVG
jgi:hypothetical protein